MQRHQEANRGFISDSTLLYEHNMLRPVISYYFTLKSLVQDRWVTAHPEHRLEQREEESREAQARRRRKRAARRIAAAQ